MKLSKLKEKYGDIDVQIVDINDYDLMICGIRKPQLKKIDMSRCIDGIDCEFSDNNERWMIGKLEKIIPDEAPYFKRDSDTLNDDFFNNCRPRMNHIHGCPDGFDECPLPEGFRVEVHRRNDTNLTIVSNLEIDWQNVGNRNDIIAFRVLGIAEGYKY